MDQDDAGDDRVYPLSLRTCREMMTDVSAGAVSGEEQFLEVGVFVYPLFRSGSGDMREHPFESVPGVFVRDRNRKLRRAAVVDGDG